MRIYLIVFLVVSMFRISAAQSKVEVYPGAAKEYKSARYSVEVVEQGRTYNTFVYQDKNNSDLVEMANKFNHYCTFGFGGNVKVVVTKLTGNIENAKVYPLAFGIQPNIIGNSMSFELSRHCQLYIQFEGEENNPLFIFADPIEIDVPTTKQPNVLFIPASNDSAKVAQLIEKNPQKTTLLFGNGVHTIGRQFKLKANTRYYISGGAIVYGTMVGDDENHVRIDGRGIISGKRWPIIHGVKGIPFNTMNLGDSSVVQGIIIENSLHFGINSGRDMLIDRVKFFGWDYNNDGIEADDNSVVSNCFFKVQDDYIKVYSSKMTCENLVMYQQKNGAIFQLNWNRAHGDVTDFIARNIYVVQSDVTRDYNEKAGNCAFVCITKNPGQRVFRNFVFENIYIEQDISKLISLNMERGGVEDFMFKDISVGGNIKFMNVFDTKDSTAFVKNITFKNLKYKNQSITSDSLIQLNKIGVGTMDDIKYKL